MLEGSGWLVVLAARMVREEGGSVIEPEHLLFAAIHETRGGFAEGVTELLGERCASPDPAGGSRPLDDADGFVGFNQASSRLLGAASGWALSQQRLRIELEDLLVALLWLEDFRILVADPEGSTSDLRGELRSVLQQHDKAIPDLPARTDADAAGWPVVELHGDVSAFFAALRDREDDLPPWPVEHETDEFARVHVSDGALALELAGEVGLRAQLVL